MRLDKRKMNEFFFSYARLALYLNNIGGASIKEK